MKQTIEYDTADTIRQTELVKKSRKSLRTIKRHIKKMTELGHAIQVMAGDPPKPVHVIYMQSAVTWLQQSGNIAIGRPSTVIPANGSMAAVIKNAGYTLEQVRLAVCAGFPRSSYAKYMRMHPDDMTPAVRRKALPVIRDVKKFLTRKPAKIKGLRKKKN